MSLTEEEIPLVEELKTRTTELLTTKETQDDAFIVKWVRARNNDLDLAEAMLRNSFTWRTEHSISDLVEKEIDPIFAEKYPRALEGHDKEGRPVITIPFGLWDAAYTVSTPEITTEFRDYTFQGCELIMNAIKKADEEAGKANKDKRITQFVIIIDMAGFSFMTLLNVYAVQMGLSMLGEYEANYPETLHSCFLINCTSAIGMLLNLVKGVLAEKTYNKIKVLGTSVDEWQPALLEAISEDELSVQFGGIRIKDDEENDVEEALEALSDSDDDEFVEAREVVEDN